MPDPRHELPNDLVFRATNISLMDMRVVPPADEQYPEYLAVATSWTELALARLKALQGAE